ncbi:hypothetical protein XELAEV_18003974mg, partial [Xenopus laevis]
MGHKSLLARLFPESSDSAARNDLWSDFMVKSALDTGSYINAGDLQNKLYNVIFTHTPPTPGMTYSDLG